MDRGEFIGPYSRAAGSNVGKVTSLQILACLWPTLILL